MKKLYMFLDKYFKWIYLGIGIVFLLFIFMESFLLYSPEYIFDDGRWAGEWTYSKHSIGSKMVHNGMVRGFSFFLSLYIISAIIVAVCTFFQFKNKRLHIISFVPFLIFCFGFVVTLIRNYPHHVFGNAGRLVPSYTFYINLIFLIYTLFVFVLYLKYEPTKVKFNFKRKQKFNLSTEIEKLSGLHEQGKLTDEEYAAAKQKLLG